MAENESMDCGLRQRMRHLSTKQDPDPQEKNPNLRNNNDARHETLLPDRSGSNHGPTSSKWKDAILTIVDHGCSRAAIFIPCTTTITGPGIAQLYLQNVYPWFGLPSRVISDRDPRFTSQFGKALTMKLGINRNISTAFHPQTDGLSERKNQWIEQYLRMVTSASPEDWTQ
jgi:hypothetical protein